MNRNRGSILTLVLTIVAACLLAGSVTAQVQTYVPPSEKDHGQVGSKAAISEDASDSALRTDKEKQSYAVGMNVAAQIKAKSMDLDDNLVVRGVKDGLSGQVTLLSEPEARALLMQLRQDIKQKASAARPEKLNEKASQQESNSSNLPAKLAASLSDIRVSFKMDARLSGPTYGGERWIVSPTFTSPVQPGNEATVEARVDSISSNGASVVTSAEWKPADTKMITVVPGVNKEVKITVHHPGETKLVVASNGVSKQLLVKVMSLANGSATQVEFTEAQ